MSLETGIAQLLIGTTAITTLVGNHIYYVVVPESASYPCLSFQVVSGSTEWNLDSTVIQEKRIQFDAWASDYATVKAIEEALSSLLDGYVGTLPDGTGVIGCFSGVVIDNWEFNSRVYRTTCEFNFQF